MLINETVLELEMLTDGIVQEETIPHHQTELNNETMDTSLLVNNEKMGEQLLEMGEMQIDNKRLDGYEVAT